MYGQHDRDHLVDHLDRLEIDDRFDFDKHVIYWFSGAHRFLSNFYPCTIEYNGKIYPSTEHAYQAAKTLDENWEEAIRVAETPGKAKSKGLQAPLRDDWEEIKDSVMAEVLEIKFKDLKLRNKLLKTYSAYLVEGTTWHDNYWGICILKNCIKCEDIKAKNRLGVSLMELREKLRKQSKE